MASLEYIQYPFPSFYVSSPQVVKQRTKFQTARILSTLVFRFNLSSTCLSFFFIHIFFFSTINPFLFLLYLSSFLFFYIKNVFFFVRQDEFFLRTFFFRLVRNLRTWDANRFGEHANMRTCDRPPEGSRPRDSRARFRFIFRAPAFSGLRKVSNVLLDLERVNICFSSVLPLISIHSLPWNSIATAQPGDATFYRLVCLSTKQICQWNCSSFAQKLGVSDGCQWKGIVTIFEN